MKKRKKVRDPKKIKVARRKRWLKGQYGITEGEYRKLYRRQGGRCGICSRSLPKLHVDHEHSSGRIRGLLCSNCNLAIGHFKDNWRVILRGARYVKDGGTGVSVPATPRDHTAEEFSAAIDSGSIHRLRGRPKHPRRRRTWDTDERTNVPEA